MDTKQKDLKWEKQLWFLPNTEEHNEQNALFYDDYIYHPKKSKRAIISMNDKFVNLMDYNIWIGHTNFKLNKNEIDTIIRSIEGVDDYNIMSQYRLQICIGKLFNGEEVRKKVKEKLCCKKVDNDKFFVILKDKESKRIIRKSAQTKEELEKFITSQHTIIKRSWE